MLSSSLDLGSVALCVSMSKHEWSPEGSSRCVKSTEGLSGDGKACGSISGCVKICKGLSGVLKIWGAICAQKASSDNGLDNGRWCFLDSGKVPEGIFIFWELAEFTFSCKFLNHLFSTLAVRGWRDFACSDEFRIICLLR